MGVHIAVDSGDVFWEGFCWRGRGRGWVLVDKGCVVPSFVVFV